MENYSCGLFKCITWPKYIKKSFYWNEDKIKAGISVQGNWRNQNFPGTLPQRKNMVTGTFERDFDINPFSYALGMSRTLRPRNINVNWSIIVTIGHRSILNEFKNNYMRIEVLDFKIIMLIGQNLSRDHYWIFSGRRIILVLGGILHRPSNMNRNKNRKIYYSLLSYSR